ncbi:hypothetical protein P389DRAFT_19671 [Cystobasidium minutum MCA 4210]|uniref:uncharacterized protein n=1 Tax=Cystobasidium minutum MCA 4210 TaxID=1397322 RepID=UPI0034CEB333|eukprot:jgi/Rhomi1/19671/CE19670_16
MVARERSEARSEAAECISLVPVASSGLQTSHRRLRHMGSSRASQGVSRHYLRAWACFSVRDINPEVVQQASMLESVLDTR